MYIKSFIFYGSSPHEAEVIGWIYGATHRKLSKKIAKHKHISIEMSPSGGHVVLVLRRVHGMRLKRNPFRLCRRAKWVELPLQRVADLSVLATPPSPSSALRTLSPNAVVTTVCCVWRLSLKYYTSFISSCDNNNYANRCHAKRGQEPEMAMMGRVEKRQQASKRQRVSAACLSKATPFAVSHFFAIARTIFYGQACQICRMRQRQV